MLVGLTRDNVPGVATYGWVMAAAALMAAGCSSESSPPAGEADASTATVAVPTEPESVRLAAQMAEGTDALRVLLPEHGVWRVDGERLLSRGWVAETSTLSHIGARIPQRAGGSFEVGLGQDARYRLHLSPEGANRDSTSVEHEGRVLYAGAYPSADVIVASNEDVFEAFVVMKDKDAPHEFTWRVDRSGGLARVSEEPTRSLLFSTAEGRDMLRFGALWAIDAEGVRREPTLTWDGTRVKISVDVEGLAYPILLDSFLEPPIWKKLSVTGPSARRGAAMAADHFGSDKIVLFGGQRGTGLPLVYLADTWEWANGAWTQTAVAPALAPSARAYASMAAATTGVLLFGGANGSSVSGETWVYASGAWTKKTPGSPPPARYGAAMAFSTSGALLYGGLPSATGSPLNDTWI